jgi:hypothetical protein
VITVDGAANHLRITPRTVLRMLRGAPVELTGGVPANDMRWPNEDALFVFFRKLGNWRLQPHHGPPAQLVYYLCSPTGHVKIGTSTDVVARLGDLTPACPVPLELRASEVGGHAVEARRHRMFVHAWTHSEWFEARPELMAWIDVVRFGVDARPSFDQAMSSSEAQRDTEFEAWRAEQTRPILKRART